MAAIYWTCNERKTPRDLKTIAKAKRLAEEHQAFLERQQEKVPGRRLPSRKQWERLQRSAGLAFEETGSPPDGATADAESRERQ